MHLLFDCTYTRLATGSVGITRTVRELARPFLAMRGDGFDVSLVAWSPQGYRLLPDNALDGQDKPALSISDTGIMRILNLVSNRKLRAVLVQLLPLWMQHGIWRFVSGLTYGNAAANFPLVLPAPNQILFSGDASWSYDASGVLMQARAKGMRTVTAIMDLIPINRPEFCVPLFTVVFERWLNQVLAFSDALVGISQATCDEVKDYCARHQLQCPPIAPFRLGSSPLQDRDGDNRVRRQFVPPGAEHETFLVVGSIEPRKNHGYILDAFEAVWAAYPRARLIIVGRIADGTETTVSRILGHPRLGRELQFITDCSDAELDALYRTTRALVFASSAEGFGLPLVEARQRGCWVLASDLPAFRELVDEGVRLFHNDQPKYLAAAVLQMLEEHLPTPPKMSVFGWDDSAKVLLARIGELLAAVPTKKIVTR
jgi:glycosyltransferase involved in cell wall biosynthesis